ncbi:nucleotidyltransferase domain-containing protein [Nonomuraea sp. NPDC046802]|uniref:nucleotidyltransferase domain-containing protein n=1 Tax=Nonomuraea sp. NPDC046802 TaxID=3154919 RepID=UPI0033C0775D
MPVVQTDASAALAIIGVTTEAIRELLGSAAEGGRLYLVGSLAAGLGSRGSDIDIHIFTEDPPAGNTPMMFFLDDHIVDFLYFKHGAPSAACTTLSARTVELPFGHCALGRGLPFKQQNRLSRWVTALPFDREEQLLLDADQRRTVGGVLVRSALDEVVAFAAMGTVLDAAKMPSRMFWRRAARQTLHALCRAAGELYIGEKWLWRNARHAGLDPSLLDEGQRVRSASEFTAFAVHAQLPAFCPEELVRLRVGDFERFSLAGGVYGLVNDSRLVLLPHTGDLEERSLADALVQTSPSLLAEMLAEQLVSLEPDPTAIDKELL